MGSILAASWNICLCVASYPRLSKALLNAGELLASFPETEFLGGLGSFLFILFLESCFMGLLEGVSSSVWILKQLFFSSQCSVVMIKQQLMRKGGEASLESEWRIRKKEKYAT